MRSFTLRLCAGAAAGAAALAAAAFQPAAGAPVASSDVVAGEHAAYRGTTPDEVARQRRPVNRPADYDGPPLEVQAVDIGRDAGEPTIGVDKLGNAYMTASEFDALGVPGVLARTELRKSSDGGKSWTTITPPLPGPVQGEPPITLDPYLWLDTDTGRLFDIELYVGCSYLLYTDDGGETWGRNPAACGIPVNDHQTLVTGPPPEGITTRGYPNVVYYCVNQAYRGLGPACSNSLDGGTTFVPTGVPVWTGADCFGVTGHLVTDAAGRVFLPQGHCGYPWLAVSEDAGATWSTYQVSEEINVAGFQTAVAVDDKGHVYYVWWDDDEKLPWFSASADHGATWSTPRMIAPPGVHAVNFPSIDAAGDGRVAISFPGTTDDTDDARRPWNYYVVTSVDAMAPNPLFISTTANAPADPVHRGNCNNRCGGMFDFLDVVIAPSGEIWAAETDTCTDTCLKKDVEGNWGGTDDGQGIAVRQLSGPGMSDRPLVTPAKPHPAPAPQPKPAPAPAPKPGGALPSTGVPAGVAWAALVATATALALRRSSRLSK